MRVAHRTRSRTAFRDVRGVSAALSDTYADWDHYNRHNPLDELLFIICSLQTNEQLYTSTFSNLRRRFPRFQDLHIASESALAETLARGGLSRQKARLVKRTLDIIVTAFGRPTLAPLRAMSDLDCERFLTSLPGVGVKTARCVMMYSLGRRVFPVDSNCWRICRRLGWVRPTRPDHSCSPRDMDRVQAGIPPKLRFKLHANLVSLGRQVCQSIHPRCAICPIRRYCRRFGVL